MSKLFIIITITSILGVSAVFFVLHKKALVTPPDIYQSIKKLEAKLDNHLAGNVTTHQAGGIQDGQGSFVLIGDFALLKQELDQMKALNQKSFKKFDTQINNHKKAFEKLAHQVQAQKKVLEEIVRRIKSPKAPATRNINDGDKRKLDFKSTQRQSMAKGFFGKGIKGPLGAAEQKKLAEKFSTAKAFDDFLTDYRARNPDIAEKVEQKRRWQAMQPGAAPKPNFDLSTPEGREAAANFSVDDKSASIVEHEIAFQIQNASSAMTFGAMSLMKGVANGSIQ